MIIEFYGQKNDSEITCQENDPDGITLITKNGYQAVADFLAKKFLDFGGEIRYRTRAAKILTEDRKAIGVEAASGERFYGENIVSNADTKKTFFELVGRETLPRKFAAKIDAHTPSGSGISLHTALFMMAFTRSTRDSPNLPVKRP